MGSVLHWNCSVDIFCNGLSEKEKGCLTTTSTFY